MIIQLEEYIPLHYGATSVNEYDIFVASTDLWTQVVDVVEGNDSSSLLEHKGMCFSICPPPQGHLHQVHGHLHPVFGHLHQLHTLLCRGNRSQYTSNFNCSLPSIGVIVVQAVPELPPVGSAIWVVRPIVHGLARHYRVCVAAVRIPPVVQDRILENYKY